MFRAEYLELDRILANSDDFVALGTYLHIHDTPAAHDAVSRWRVDSMEKKRSYRAAQDSERRLLPDSELPNEAILVGKRFTSAPSIQYWNDSLYSGGGTASSNLWVLASNSNESIAWIERELASELGLLQLRRAGIGSTLSTLPGDSLLEVRIRQRSIDEQRSINSVLVHNLRSEMYSASYRALKRPIILTGDTFEERLREFERFLCEDTLFNSADIFFVESATGSESSDLFVVRPVSQPDKARDTSTQFPESDTSEVDARWRDWYWSDASTNHYRVFNSVIARDYSLPVHLITRTVAPWRFPKEGASLPIPDLGVFASAFDSQDQLGEFSDTDFAIACVESMERHGFTAQLRDLCQVYGVSEEQPELLINSGALLVDLAEWGSAIFRPALAVRVFREQRVVGAYLLFGNSQASAPREAYGWLDDMGMAFQEILSPPPHPVEHAARRESLRRLSWL
jgi:hypothetical protein